jgi:ribonuclease J
MSSSELVFVALGGLGEIGMNAALYGIGTGAKRKWLLVDVGVSFAGEDVPGVDLILPDISFIVAEKRNLAGIIITHAHEDHFGALADLWPQLGANVYMTRFAADLLEARRLGEPGAPKIPVKIVEQGSRIDIGPFNVEFIPVAHSIPESCALAIRTEAGTVLHTGDWKIDDTPVVGRPTDAARLMALGDEGVLAMVCDSTNVVRDGVSPSEADVAATLKELIAAAPYRVAVTTFASNVARLRSVAEAAAACGRQVVVVGRAMDRVVDVATELGYLDGLPDFRSVDSYNRLPRDKVVALLTGSQGEPRAALARVASDEHPDISLAKGDQVIFSSRTIPGNEKGVGRIVNDLVRQGIEVITDRTRLVHVSGHPRRAEMAKMYSWVRPAIVVPAHGEALHLTEHAAFVRAQGVKNVVRAFNGDVVRLAPGPAEIVRQIQSGRIYKDGDLMVGTGEPSVPERRKLAFAGLVSVAVAMDDKGDVVADPEITFTGVPKNSEDGDSMQEIIADAVDEVLEGLPKAKRRDVEAVRNAVERAVRACVNDEWHKKPMCHVMVMRV